MGKSDFPSDMPSDASKMFGSNVVNLMKIMISKEGKFDLDLRNEIISQTCAVHNGEYVSPMLRKILNIK